MTEEVAFVNAAVEVDVGPVLAGDAALVRLRRSKADEIAYHDADEQHHGKADEESSGFSHERSEGINAARAAASAGTRLPLGHGETKVWKEATERN